MNRKTVLLLLAITLISLFLHVYQYGNVPPCVNADEASYGYNTYSILKTGRDEYGTKFPLRLKSFGDFKLPLYSYVTTPFVAAFGLNEFSTRLPAAIIGILFPLVMFFLVRELFEDEIVALTAAFLISISPWFQIMSRQAHESLLATLFISLGVLTLLKFLKSGKNRHIVITATLLLFALFSYHISRLLALAIFLFAVWKLFINRQSSNFPSSKKIVVLTVLLIPLLLFFLTDLRFSPDRVKNLAFYNNRGFSLKIDELRGEHDVRLIHNKFTQAALDLPKEYLKYFSPQFLVISGDENLRFGYPGISPISVVEYIFLFVGLYYLFVKKEKNRDLILLLLFTAPLTASLAWQEYSLNRSFFMIIPIVIVVAYGFVSFIKSFEKQRRFLIPAVIIVPFLFFVFCSWEFYFFHYPKRATVIRSWQCGNREMAQYVNDNYNKFDHFYITRRNGQPYIFLLFYNTYDPRYYQHQAQLSKPDEFGFGQVEKFDKFTFDFHFNPKLKRTAFIGYPDEFNGTGITSSMVKKIIVGGQEIFWIYER